MKSRLNSPFVIWLLLVALTLLSVAIAKTEPLGQLSFLVIVLIAAVKSRIIILDYMEAREAPAHWRLLYSTWIYIMAAIIMVGHGMALHNNIS